MTKFKVTFEVIHIDKSDKWTQLYEKVLYKSKSAENIKELMNKLQKKYGGDIEIHDNSFVSLILYVQELPNGDRIETNIDIWNPEDWHF
jgi:predicted nucleic acid-binding protein